MEQEALSNILFLQREAMNGKIAESSDTDAVKDVLLSAMQPATDVKIEDIVRASIQGKERKHFKAECVSEESRTSLLRKI